MKLTDNQNAETLQQIQEFENIPRMWEHSVAKYSSLPAIRESGKTYTYSELNEAIGRFRGHLYEKGFRPGDSIRISAERSTGFVKTFLAAQTLGLTVTVLPEGSTEDALTSEEYCEDCAGRDPGVIYPDSEAPAIVMFTGGSTGKPKGAVLSHRCVMVSVRNACYGYPNVFGQKYLHALPMHHVFGLIRSMLTCLATGGTLILCPDPRMLFVTAMMENPTMAVLVPVMIEYGVTKSRETGRNLFGNSIHTIITGAAPVAQHLVADCRELNITLYAGYGLTETGCLISGNPDMEGHPGSVGLLYPDQEVRFVDGELQVRGRNIMMGYTDTEDSGLTQDGWFATGDLGYMDEEGFLYLLGRKKEMLLTASGENVYPAFVEEKFNALPEVTECELFEAKDGTLHLEVFPRNPNQFLSEQSSEREKLLAKLVAVNSGLPKHEQATVITLRMTDFPRTKNLKLIRRGTAQGQI